MDEKEFRSKELRFIKHSQAEEFAAAGWTVEELNNHHGKHAKLAWRHLDLIDPIKREK